jgi:D-amino peptidase
MHAGGGSGGFLAHTGTFGGERIVNGRSVNETDIFAMRFGARGIPIIFASGDDYLSRQVSERLPWVFYVEVKRAITPAQAELRPVDQVRAELRDRAKSALEQRARAKAVRLVAPFTGGFRPLPPLRLQPLVDVPGIVIRDSVITFAAPSVPELMQGIARIFNVLSKVAENDTWWTVSRNHPDVVTSYRTLYIQRALDGEAARRTPGQSR